MTVLDNGEPSLKSTSRVVIHIVDVNDNPPVFSHKLFNVRLPERLSPATPGPVYRLVASDPDEGLNGRVTYSIEESDEESFSIDPVTGMVSSSSIFMAGEYNILTVRRGWRPQRGESHNWLVIFFEDTGEGKQPSGMVEVVLPSLAFSERNGSPDISESIRILGLSL